MGRLFRYILGKMLLRFVLAMLVLFIMVFLGETIDMNRKVQNIDISMNNVLLLALLKTPKTLVLMIPFAVLISGGWAISTLARKSELVAIFAGGGSAWTIIKPIVAGGFGLGMAITLIITPSGALINDMFERMSEKYFGKDDFTSKIGAEDLWFRTMNEQGQSLFVRANKIAPEEKTMRGVDLFVMDHGNLLNHREADELSFDGQNWLAKGKSFDPAQKISIGLGFDDIAQRIEGPSWMPIWNLPEHINSLKNAGFAAKEQILRLNRDLAGVLLAIGLAVIGASLPIGYRRGGNIGRLIAMTVGVGFVTFIANDISFALGKSGQVPVIIAAWAPAVLSMIVGIILLRKTGEC